jgi:triosephosphate isomerase
MLLGGSGDMRHLIAGNWKMNGLAASVEEAARIAAGAEAYAEVDVMICPPATLIAQVAGHLRGAAVQIGGQDCHPLASGAFTGDVSAEMLKDAGAAAVIVGHSERRVGHGEDDALVRRKAEAARRAGLTAIVCIGETEDEREDGRTLDIVDGQIARSLPDGEPADIVVAYEPVWAIGTGRTPVAADIAEVHSRIRERLIGRFGRPGAAVRILYGGSLKPDNAAAILALREVNGGLVGGASLKAGDFLAIVRASAGSSRVQSGSRLV